MSLSIGLLPRLAPTTPRIFSRRFLSSTPTFREPSNPSALRSALLRRLNPAQQPRAISIPKTTSKPSSSKVGLYSLGLGLSFLAYQSLNSPNHSVQCQSQNTLPVITSNKHGGDPPPQSILSVYELSFGAVCGICAGVFVKKGLKAIAFLLGGVFVLLQYMSSRSFISVDWKKLSSRYDSAFGTQTSEGGTRYPTIGGVWQRSVDFLTANFQQRASFLAGLVLGLRLG